MLYFVPLFLVLIILGIINPTETLAVVGIMIAVGSLFLAGVGLATLLDIFND